MKKKTKSGCALLCIVDYFYRKAAHHLVLYITDVCLIFFFVWIAQKKKNPKNSCGSKLLSLTISLCGCALHERKSLNTFHSVKPPVKQQDLSSVAVFSVLAAGQQMSEASESTRCDDTAVKGKWVLRVRLVFTLCSSSLSALCIFPIFCLCISLYVCLCVCALHSDTESTRCNLVSTRLW